MNGQIRLNKSSKQPIYLQIVESVKERIKEGALRAGDQLPSINYMSSELGLAKETIVKSFRLLQEKGIIHAVHGKGYFVATDDISTEHRVFVLFDTLSAYKEILYNAIKEEFGKNAFIDIYFHHFNPKIFDKLVAGAAGNYTSYIILPFDSPEVFSSLECLPAEKIYILDRKPRMMTGNYPCICQDFHNDVYSLLASVEGQIAKYRKIVLVFRNTVTQVPPELREGFVQFCTEKNIAFAVTENPLCEFSVEKGIGYIVIDDEDLVCLAEQAKNQELEIGKNLGIISYNDTSLKKVVAGGISVISTDFGHMGRTVAEMIKTGSKGSLKNPCRFIDRKSF
ncbi:MAG: GntR family transcriptional regulator [Prolixibacteraceae bacterium]|jgi:DNA-binding transcriptional regulator YhcF (GntR family)|nr:GntR family transcriptional regulator [Prolixibacteraceae bacterium]